jgi:MFS family permease
VAAVLSDRYGSRRVFVVGAVTAVVWPLPMFALVNTGSAGLAGLAFAVAAVVQGIMAGAQGGLFSEIFPVRVRYSGISIAYQVGGMVGGAVTPLVATALYGATRSSTPIALYVTVLSLLSLLAVFGLREGSARSAESQPAVSRPPG